LEGKIANCSVKEHEIAVVSAMIDQKVKLAEEKTQLKRNCKDEKKKLESELERAQ